VFGKNGEKGEKKSIAALAVCIGGGFDIGGDLAGWGKEVRRFRGVRGGKAFLLLGRGKGKSGQSSRLRAQGEE